MLGLNRTGTGFFHNRAFFFQILNLYFILFLCGGNSYENFMKHFSDTGFYGAMVCMHFIPWMICSKDECGKLSNLFETDLHGKDFWELSLSCGGDDANKRIYDIVKHASDKGYMSNL